MGKRLRILLSGVCLALVGGLLGFGVYASTTATYAWDATLHFDADVYCGVSAKIYEDSDEYIYSYNTVQKEIAEITNITSGGTSAPTASGSTMTLALGSINFTTRLPYIKIELTISNYSLKTITCDPPDAPTTSTGLPTGYEIIEWGTTNIEIDGRTAHTETANTGTWECIIHITDTSSLTETESAFSLGSTNKFSIA